MNDQATSNGRKNREASVPAWIWSLWGLGFAAVLVAGSIDANDLLKVGLGIMTVGGFFYRWHVCRNVYGR